MWLVRWLDGEFNTSSLRFFVSIPYFCVFFCLFFVSYHSRSFKYVYTNYDVFACAVVSYYGIQLRTIQLIAIELQCYNIENLSVRVPRVTQVCVCVCLACTCLYVGWFCCCLASFTIFHKNVVVFCFESLVS